MCFIAELIWAEANTRVQTPKISSDRNQPTGQPCNSLAARQAGPYQPPVVVAALTLAALVAQFEPLRQAQLGRLLKRRPHVAVRVPLARDAARRIVAPPSLIARVRAR